MCVGHFCATIHLCTGPGLTTARLRRLPPGPLLLKLCRFCEVSQVILQVSVDSTRSGWSAGLRCWMRTKSSFLQTRKAVANGSTLAASTGAETILNEIWGIPRTRSWKFGPERDTYPGSHVKRLSDDNGISVARRGLARSGRLVGGPRLKSAGLSLRTLR